VQILSLPMEAIRAEQPQERLFGVFPAVKLQEIPQKATYPELMFKQSFLPAWELRDDPLETIVLLSVD
jgi:hypothetical protein